MNKFLNVKLGLEELEGKLILKCNQGHKHICCYLESKINLVSTYEETKAIATECQHICMSVSVLDALLRVKHF